MRYLILCALFWLITGAAQANPDQPLQEGLRLLQADRVEEAIESLRQAQRQLIDGSRAKGLLGEAYLRLGMKKLAGGEETAAREAFATAKDYLPDDPRPWQGTAIAWLHSGQPVAAIGELNEALALAGERPDLLLLLGRAHYAAGELLQAEDAWQRGVNLGGDEELTTLLEKGSRELQTERTMSRDLAGRFTLAYANGVNDRLAGQVLEVLQDAYQELGRELGYYPEADIPVLLYAREDFAAVTRSPAWAGAVYDGKIRVPLGGVASVSPQLKALLYHEYTHVVVRFLGKGRVPVWLNEGLAEVAGRRYHTPHMSKPGKEQVKSVALERPFTELPDELVPLAYQQSYQRVQRLIELCGWPAVADLLQRLGRGDSWEGAIAAAYAPCGYDWPRLQVELEDEFH